MPPDFRISHKGPVSKKFLELKIQDFKSAMQFIKGLPYGRNANKEDLLTLFSDHCGTCSTKHALLKQLADENGFKGLQLMLGVFKMNASNSPLVASTLKRHGLVYLPEAHNYLRFENEIIDCTKKVWDTDAIISTLLQETEIKPEQITTYKVTYHRAFLEQWLQENPQASYKLDELWAIREQCIADLGT